MLGKASEIETELLVEYANATIADEIAKWTSNNPNVVVLDIKFCIMQNGENVNETYREALIIYKEE